MELHIQTYRLLNNGYILTDTQTMEHGHTDSLQT